MALLAKRVSALESEPRMASTSVTPCARAASTTWPKTASALCGIGAPDFRSVEARGAGSVAGAHHLLGLAFAAVGDAPQRPVLGAGDGRAGVPELGGNAAVAGVLQHADALAVTHLPGDFAAELEMVALVVDGPTAIGLHVDGVAGAHHFVERLLAREQAHVGHADERQAGPAFGAHAAVGARLAHGGGGFARGHVAGELAGADDIGGLRGHAFIVESESAETGAVLKASVADHVDDLGAVAQVVELIEGEKAHAGVVGFGAEANYAGMSFLTLDQLHHLRYGSEIVNVVCDARLEHGPGLGTFAFDDEGVPAQSTDIIRAGQFTGYMTSRETAAAVGQQRSNGCMRADGWARLPLIRMTNVSLLPGEQSLDEVMDADHAIYMETNRSWSIDDKRYNFQFGCEIAWEMRHGKRIRMLKNPSYSGISTEFWNACAAIAGPPHWTLWGVPNCGKGQPEQVMGTGHGASPARFHTIKIGSAYAG